MRFLPALGCGLLALSLPLAAARATELSQADAANTQFAANRTAAGNTLALSESILGNVTLLLQDVTTALGDAALQRIEKLSDAQEHFGLFLE